MARVRNFFARLGRFKRNESGAALIFVGVAMAVLMGFTALAVDMGLVYYQRSKLQTALDAAALAAAYELPPRTLDVSELAIAQIRAEATVQQYMLKNGYSYDDVESVEILEDNTVVRVVGHIDTSALFASVIDVESIGSNGVAAAKYAVRNKRFDFDHLIFQGASAHLELRGATTVVNGSIHSNGTYYVDTHWTIQHIQGVSETGSYINAGSWGGAQVGSFENGVDFIEMPDWDGELMALTVPPAAQTVPSWPHRYYITLSGSPNKSNYLYTMTGTNSWDNTTVAGVTIYGEPVRLKVTDDFSSTSRSLTFCDDVYFTGNVELRGTTIFRGDVYIDGNLTFNGAGTTYFAGGVYIKGNAEYKGKVTFMGDSYTGGNMTFSSWDASHVITMNGSVYVNGYLKSEVGNGTLNVNKSIMVAGNSYIKNVKYKNTDSGNCTAYFSGKTHFNDANISINGAFYSGGNGNPPLRLRGGVLYISDYMYNSNGVDADGCVFVDGNIYFTGPTTFLDTSNAVVAVYSRQGNILFTSARTVAYGLIFAPNGEIKLDAQLEFYGNIIGDTLDISTGGLIVGNNTREMPFGISTRTSLLVE